MVGFCLQFLTFHGILCDNYTLYLFSLIFSTAAHTHVLCAYATALLIAPTTNSAKLRIMDLATRQSSLNAYPPHPFGCWPFCVAARNRFDARNTCSSSIGAYAGARLGWEHISSLKVCRHRGSAQVVQTKDD